MGTHQQMSFPASSLACLWLRRRPMPALVQVSGERRWVELHEQPSVGAILDVGFPVQVIATKQVAGGGMLIEAEPTEIDHGG